MRKVAIIDAVRTPVGKMGGALCQVAPEDLAGVVIKGLLNRTGIPCGDLDEVIFGQAKQSTDAANVARVAALRYGVAEHVPAYSVMRACGSGMQAIMNGKQLIQAEDGEIVLAGGTENMSMAPFYLRDARYGWKFGHGVLLDSNTESQPRSQPEEIYGRLSMGECSDDMAKRFGITREEQDAYALQSQKRALAAIAGGRFNEYIVPVPYTDIQGKNHLFTTDEYPRETSMELLGKLNNVFRPDGTATAGNSSGRNDGAAGVLLMTAKKAAEYSLTPKAYIRAMSIASRHPAEFPLAPSDAARLVLKKAGMNIEQIDLFEVNEAFSSVPLLFMRDLGISPDIVNVNGGAVSIGHPLGCSGARIIVELLYEMQRKHLQYGLASICVAGGMGTACILELADSNGGCS